MCDFRAGIAAANVVLRDWYMIDVRKALNPLNQKDYLVIERRLAKALNISGVAEEQAIIEATSNMAGLDWGNMSEAARERTLDAARRTVAASGAKVLPRSRGVLDVEGERIIGETRKATKKRYRLDIETSTTDFDKQIGNHIVSSQANFSTTEFGVRVDAFADESRRIVERGLELGEGRIDIGQRLHDQARVNGIARKRGYWDVVAGSFANRGRTFAQLSSYQDADITRYVIDAVMDEATTDICRFLHGQTFTVGSGIAKFNEVDTLEQPEAMKDVTPWVRTTTVDGQLEMSYKTGGETFSVGRVLESAVGKPDESGRFGNTLSGDQLAQRGISFPPFHGFCRSSVVPDI